MTLEALRQIESALDLILTETIFLVMAYVLTLKALNLRRVTPLGRALARNNLAFAVGYLGACLALWIAVFRTDAWSYAIRLVILATTILVLREMSRAFGGWGAVHRRAWASLRDMVRGQHGTHQPDDEGY